MDCEHFVTTEERLLVYRAALQTIADMRLRPPVAKSPLLAFAQVCEIARKALEQK